MLRRTILAALVLCNSSLLYAEALPAIPVRANMPLTAKKIVVKDSRVLRGGDFAPVDGTLDSRGWNGDPYEYGRRRNYGGVKYGYKGNNGLHITLADEEGVDAIIIRGGATCKIFADCPNYDSPEGGKPIKQFSESAQGSGIVFEERLKTSKLSFFDVSNGSLANISFFRIGGEKPEGRAVTWSVVGKSAGESVAERLAKRFKGGNVVCEIGPRGAEPSIMTLSKGANLQLVSKPLASELCLNAIGISFSLQGSSGATPLTFAVQEPLNPRRELAGADFQLQGSGTYSIYLDFYDQIILPQKSIWLTLAFGDNVTLRNIKVELFQVSRAKALPEVLAYAAFILKAQFMPASEARRWMLMKPNVTDYLDWAATAPGLKGGWRYQYAELFDTLDNYRKIAPNDRTIKQFYEWIHQNRLGIFRRENMPKPKIERTPGVPEWADMLHQAYLAVRAIPEWWLDNRLVANAELGGSINDDTCMYQNFAGFVMYEDTGVGEKLMQACRTFAKYVERAYRFRELGIPRTNSDPLHYYEDGLNHIAVMTWMDYGNPVFVEHVMNAARTTEEGLTTVVRGNERYFKTMSWEMGLKDLTKKGHDKTAGNAQFLVIHPAIMALWYNKNPRAEKMLRQWADTWMKYYGTPGSYATLVEIATGKVVESGRDLSAHGQASGQILIAYILGDKKYAKPLQVISEGTSPNWAKNYAIKCITLGLIDVNAKVKSGLSRASMGHIGFTTDVKGLQDFVINKNKASLINELKYILAEMQHFGEGYTTWEPFTDRVFLRHLDSSLGMAYLGGFYTRNRWANSFAVSWKGFRTDYAALCLHARPDGLKFLVYSFADKPMNGEMTVWTLEHGQYKVTQGIDADNNDNMDRVDRNETLELHRGVPIKVTLAPKKTTVIEVKQVRKLPDIRTRADLALSVMEVKREGNAVTGIVHNIGNKPAGVVVALVDENGRVVTSQSLGTLAAPLDLHAKRVNFKLAGVPATAQGWSVVVDPQDRVSEIYEGNNRVMIPSMYGPSPGEAIEVQKPGPPGIEVPAVVLPVAPGKKGELSAFAREIATAQARAKDSDYAQAAAILEKAKGQAEGEAQQALVEMAQALGSVKDMRTWIIEGVKAGRSERVRVSFMGMRMRARLVDAGDDGLTVSVGGTAVPISWEDLTPGQLFSTAKVYAAPAGQEPPPGKTRVLAGFERLLKFGMEE